MSLLEFMDKLRRDKEKLLEKFRNHRGECVQLDYDLKEFDIHLLVSILRQLRYTELCSYLKLGDTGTQVIMPALAENAALLSLRMSNIDIGDVGAEAISAALLQHKTLTTLDLTHNRIGDIGGRALLTLVRALPTLTHFSCSHNVISDVVLQQITSVLDDRVFDLALKRCVTANNSVAFYDMRSRDYLSVSLNRSRVVQMLVVLQQHTNLQSLTLSTVFDEDGMVEFANWISRNTTLWVLSTTLGMEKHLLQGLKNNCTLDELYLDGSHLDSVENAQLLAEYLASNSGLHSLSVDGMTDIHLRLLGKSLQSNNTLWKLRCQGGKRFFQCLASNSTLRSLRLTNNARLEKSDYAELANTLATNTTLLNLHVGHHAKFDDEALIALATSLATNSTLKGLSLSLTPVGDNGVVALAKMLEQNKTLTAIDLNVTSQSIEVGTRALLEVLETKNTSLCFVNMSDRRPHYTEIQTSLTRNKLMNEPLAFACLERSLVELQKLAELSIDERNRIGGTNYLNQCMNVYSNARQSVQFAMLFRPWQEYEEYGEVGPPGPFSPILPKLQRMKELRRLCLCPALLSKPDNVVSLSEGYVSVACQKIRHRLEALGLEGQQAKKEYLALLCPFGAVPNEVIEIAAEVLALLREAPPLGLEETRELLNDLEIAMFNQPANTMMQQAAAACKQMIAKAFEMQCTSTCTCPRCRIPISDLTRTMFEQYCLLSSSASTAYELLCDMCKAESDASKTNLCKRAQKELTIAKTVLDHLIQGTFIFAGHKSEETSIENLKTDLNLNVVQATGTNEEKFQNLYAKATSLESVFRSTMLSLFVGKGEYHQPRPKSEDRCRDKMNTDYKDAEEPCQHLKDIIRATLVCKTVKCIRECLALLSQAGQDVIITGVKNNLAKPTHDVLVNVRFQGVIVELQFHLVEIYPLKLYMHAIYDVTRVESFSELSDSNGKLKYGPFPF